MEQCLLSGFSCFASSYPAVYPMIYFVYLFESISNKIYVVFSLLLTREGDGDRGVFLHFTAPVESCHIN